MKVHFILYVSDQKHSAAFYSTVLGKDPILDVPGMTEFSIGEQTILGLMPSEGIIRLLGRIGDPSSMPDVLRGEIYLVVDDPAAFHESSLLAGAQELSPLAPRDWGELVAYSLDADGYILAFASPTKPEM